jgi:hypothetical protein
MPGFKTGIGGLFELILKKWVRCSDNGVGSSDYEGRTYVLDDKSSSIAWLPSPPTFVYDLVEVSSRECHNSLTCEYSVYRTVR